MFFAGDRALWVDLGGTGSARGGCAAQTTHRFAVEDVFADHDRVDGARFPEGEEREPPGTTVLVPQDGAVLDFTKL